MAVAAPTRTVVDLMTGLFARFFPLPSWRMHVLCAAAVFGLCYGLSAEDEADILRCLGRTVLPTSAAERVALVIGRRGGKSRFASFLLVYLACFRDYGGILTPGERGVAMLVAPDRRQARTCFRYIEAFIDQTPMLAAMVVSRTRESIALSNGIDIEVHTASFRSVRGVTIVACIIDEAAFLPTDDSAEPDRELIAAIVPAMATVPGALLLLISSPYARRGELWRAYQEHFGKDGDPFLVWQAATEAMNPAVDKRIIEAAYAEDEAVASAEYGGLFRRDLEQFVSREVLDAVIVPDRGELPASSGVQYVGFVDPSGGAADSMTLGIAHRTPTGITVLDCIREIRAPFDPAVAVRDFAMVLHDYRLSEVTSDYYGGEWVVSAFRAHGIMVRTSERPKAEIYKTLIPLLTSGGVELPEHKVLRTQFLALERRTGRSGREVIDHPPRQRDDVANAAAGALVEAHARAVRGPTVAAILANNTPWQRSRGIASGRSEAMQELRDQKRAQRLREQEELRTGRNAYRASIGLPPLEESRNNS